MILANAYVSALTWASVAAYATPAAASSVLSARFSRMALLLAWYLHAVLLLTGLLGPQPSFGFAPALSVTAWLTLTVYAIESRFLPQLRARWALAGLGAATIVLAWLFPGQPVHLGSSPWLPLHWALGLASYGLFAAAVVHAWLMQRTEQQIRQGGEPPSGIPLLALERLMFRFVELGFVLLTGTLIAGWFFGEQLYGPGAKAVHWDHKTVFSLLSWLTFAVLLIGRSHFGWRGRKATRVLYTGTALLLLAYAGSRFVLEVLLDRTP